MANDQTLATRVEIIRKAWTDPVYRQKLVHDPKAVIAREFAIDLPDGLTVTALEDTADTVHLVLVDPADLLDEEKAGAKAAILGKAWTDPAFRQALLADPAAALVKAFDAKVLPGITVKAVEQTADHAFIVIPARPETLSDADLDKVAGGVSKTEGENIELAIVIPTAVAIGTVDPVLGVAIAAPVIYNDRDTIKSDGKVAYHAVKKIFHHGW